MQSLGKSFKLLAAAGSVISFAVLAGVVHDLNFNSTDFMKSERSYSLRLDDKIITSRKLASEPAQEKEIPAAQYIAYNDLNKELLAGEWEILRIFNTDGHVHFDVERYEDQGMNIVVEVEMIGTSMVWLDNDSGLEYDISYLHESSKAMALFRKLDSGYEVVEMRKREVVKAASQSEPTQNISNERRRESENPARGVSLEEYHDLTVLSAIDLDVTSDVLKGQRVDGELRVGNGEVEQLRLTLHRGTSLEKSIYLDYVRVEDGGIFSSNGSSGVILNNGENSFKVRFATGPMKDVQVIFVTYQELNRVQDLEAEQRYRSSASEDEYDSYYQDEYYDDDYNNYVDESYQRVDSKGYMTLEAMDEMRDFDSVEAREQHVQEAGFAFGQSPTYN